MKIHRLLSIIIYLLNHEVASSHVLAEKFEVSRRTIQRDIEAISYAGIPVISIPGSKGGYGLIDEYKMDKQLASSSDYTFIITALKGLYSAFHSKDIDETLEKLLALSPEKQGSKQTLFLDFSVLQENANMLELMKTIEKAITNKLVVEFNYTDAENHHTHRTVEPVALTYRWYNWYVFGYCYKKREYRLFKLSRITEFLCTKSQFSITHGNPEELMKKQNELDNRRRLDIKLLCKAEMRVAILEYLPGKIITELANGDFILQSRVVENERMWFALLLSFSNQVTVLEPVEIKERIVQTAGEISNLYADNDDI